jgi:hypothetical protein
VIVLANESSKRVEGKVIPTYPRCESGRDECGDICAQLHCYHRGSCQAERDDPISTESLDSARFVRRPPIECGSEMGWRMLMDDMPMMTDPEFEDVKKMVLQNSRTAIRWKRYLMEQQDMELSGYDGWPTTSTTTSTVPTAFATSTFSNSLKELSEQISKLTLILENQSRQ